MPFWSWASVDARSRAGLGLASVGGADLGGLGSRKVWDSRVWTGPPFHRRRFGPAALRDFGRVLNREGEEGRDQHA